ncbi:MAG: hypothetical protein CEE43_05310 [Promethearchaeota archaeon Loki_b32]|nr:MAG: hypothetical protein CEE43_05310 [Candidatus Lokiarchaeota archaeon Loki_b32]
MKIIKEDRDQGTVTSIEFFKEHYKELGEIRYLILYYAEREWSINHNLQHQYTIFIGENAQLWLFGIAWGYYGQEPSGLHEIIGMIDPEITYKQIVDLEWMAEEPIMFEIGESKFILKHITENVKEILRNGNRFLPWDIRNVSQRDKSERRT